MLVVAGIVPFLAYILVQQYLDYREDVRIASDRTLTLTRSVSLLVEKELQARILVLETLATSGLLQRGDLSGLRARAADLVTDRFPGANILLIKPDGQMVLSTAIAPDQPLGKRSNMETTAEVFATGQPNVSNLFLGSLRGQPVVAIDVPVRLMDGSIGYVLSMNPPLDVFADILRQQQLPANWLISILDRKGVRVARFPNTDRLVAREVTPKLLDLLRTQSEGTLENVSAEGIHVLSAFSRDSRFGWTVAIGIPRSELIGPDVQEGLRALGIGSVLLAIGLVLALLAARRIAGPIGSLRRLAAADGAPTPPAPTGLPEVDEVARALYTAELERQQSRAAELLLRDSIESLPEGFAIFDADDRLVMCNDSYRQLFPGRPEAVTVGSTFEDMLWQGSLGRRNSRREAEWVAARLREHQDFDAAGEQQLPDGRWALVRNRPLVNGGRAGLRIDITALKAAEVALRDSEERFRHVVEATPNAIIMVGADGTVQMVNAEVERVFGYARDELLGKPVEILLPARYRQDHPRLRRGFFAAPAARKMGVGRDLYAIRRDGSEFPVEVGLSSVTTEAGTQVLAAVIDITDLRQTQAQLHQAQKMEAIGNLTGGMAHDFNNLLGVIVGNLELAREDLPADTDVHEMVGEALGAAWRGADLTRRLLAFARRQSLRPARIDINGLVNDTVRLLGRLLGEEIEVVLNLGDDIWPVTADPAQLEASLANLATNARDAMPRGGRLIIATINRTLDADYAAEHSDVTAGDYVMIEVSDTGTGMSADTMSQIFEPFFTTKEAEKGTGLGLSMVFGFLKQSGGHVNVYSELGVGTTFRLYLPRETAEAPAPEAPGAVTAERGVGETVLVVEDNQAMRRVSTRQIRELGYRVLECDRAAAALDILQREPVDLLFTDIVMPGGLDGVELAHLARERWPQLRVVLTSGFPQARLGRNGELASLTLLSKPYHRDELAAALRAALSAG